MKATRYGLFVSTLCTVALTAGLIGQTPAEQTNGHFTFRANARTAVVDIVVSDRNGRPVKGLHKDDFLVSEDGHPQAITSFEEHALSTSASPQPPLPPNLFTNIPRMGQIDSVSVLLVDSLNTPLADQGFVHAQMLKYLEELQPGRRYAIFALGRQLVYVQGFTDDPALLSAALKNTTRGAGVQSSPMLRSYTEKNAGDHAIADLAARGTGGAKAAAALGAAFAQQEHFQEDQRVLITLDAFQQLSKYLAGIPGRKNLVWFSSAFPVVIFANPAHGDSFDIQREYGDQIRLTDALLAAAQVAIYPIAAEGLATDSLYDLQHDLPGVTTGQAVGMSSKDLQDETSRRNADHTTMDEIARETGGEAMYNTNGLNEAIARASDHGSSYYTVSYTPTNAKADGQFRKIQVKLAKGSEKLAYRRGYYAENSKEAAAPPAKVAKDPLLTSMVAGLPASTQIPFALRVEPAAPSTASNHGPDRAGDNPNLKAPFTRYAMDIVIAASGVRLDPAPNGGREGQIEATLVFYDQNGKPVNWLVRQLDLAMDEARYKQVQANGINFNLQIDAPADAATLRGGIYDWTSGSTGTLELPWTKAASATPTIAASH